jgi:hypothetical protein
LVQGPWQHVKEIDWERTKERRERRRRGRCEIWGSHGGEDDDVLGCDTVQTRSTNVSEKHTVAIYRSEDGDSIFLRNFGTYSLHDITTHKNNIVKERDIQINKDGNRAKKWIQKERKVKIWSSEKPLHYRYQPKAEARVRPITKEKHQIYVWNAVKETGALRNLKRKDSGQML